MNIKAKWWIRQNASGTESGDAVVSISTDYKIGDVIGQPCLSITKLGNWALIPNIRIFGLKYSI